jgi:hypothetical protein
MLVVADQAPVHCQDPVGLLIDSAPSTLPQLLITAEQAPDRVGEPVLPCVRRFVAVFGVASAVFARGAAAHARHIGCLLVRAYVQAPSPARRSEFLDLLDQLLLLGSYGVADAIHDSDRG